MSFRSRFLIFALLIVAAAAMRFFRLGEWSFGFDELFTILETQVFFQETPVPEEYLKGGTVKPEETQYVQLPRLMPFSYLCHWTGYRLFGTDEFGSRVLSAAIGALSVGVIFWFAVPLLGAAGGLTLSLLVLLWPEHLLQSQNNRFYLLSFFVITLMLLLGGIIARNRSRAAAWAIGPLAVLVVLTNSLGGLFWGILLLGVLFEFSTRKYFRSAEISWNILLILAGWSVILLGIAFFHILPVVGNWNQSAAWGYSPIHSAMSFINMIGWPVFLLSFWGILMGIATMRESGHSYGVFLAVMCGLSVLLLPMKIVYNPNYGFLFAFPFLIPAAQSIAYVYHLVAASRISPSKYAAKYVAAAWIVLVVLFQVPSLASYYVDGGRPDNRSAFQYVAEHWQQGDRLAGFLMGTAKRYSPEAEPRFPLPTFETAHRLQEIVDADEASGGRLWIVLQSSRGGLSDELRFWLGRNTILMARFGKKRFDYAENNVDVYLHVPKDRDRPSTE